MDLLRNYKTLLVDMNGTFMFGGDRFAPGTDYSRAYRGLGGEMPDSDVNRIIRRAFEFLNARYGEASWLERFPTVHEAIEATAGVYLRRSEVGRLVQTFAHHELGDISARAAESLRTLSQRFRMALVTDVWAPKLLWVRKLEAHGLHNVFDLMSFSSDSGVVKPSPVAFRDCIDRLRADPAQTVVIGDSVERDLGGASAARLDCILIGGAQHNAAVGDFEDLTSLVQTERVRAVTGR
ncbi:MAG: HAD family hydrolase [Gammaproteobacteria bacterium]|nr:HAD family hydrolase [Gammaproteobacteria bacterium]